jgi:hypothetical protein
MKQWLGIISVLALVCAGTTVRAEDAVDQDGWKTAAQSGLVFRWKVNGSDLDCSVKGATTGWIAVGFNGAAVMNGANIIIGYVDAKGVVIEDQLGRNHGHSRDAVQNVKNPFGEEIRGQTELRFTIPLDSGDNQDFKLEPGRPVFVIMAMGRKDKLTGIHWKKVTVRIDL